MGIQLFCTRRKTSNCTMREIEHEKCEQKWSSLTTAEKVPYVERSMEDKASLGPHYREGRVWKNKKMKIAKI